jgi:hypothetical protein
MIPLGKRGTKIHVQRKAASPCPNCGADRVLYDGGPDGALEVCERCGAKSDAVPAERAREVTIEIEAEPPGLAWDEHEATTDVNSPRVGLLLKSRDPEGWT